MSRRNRTRIVIAVIVALGGVGVALLQTRPDLHPLALTRKITGWTGADPDYWWISAQEILFLRAEGRGNLVFVRHNVQTSAETPLVALTKLYRDSGATSETIRLSPAGTWILWTGAGNVNLVATLDGKKHFAVPQLGPTLNVWKYDSLGWFALETGEQTIDRATEHSLDAPNRVARPRYVAFPFPNDPHRVNMARITTTEQEQLLVPYWTGGAGQLTRADILVTGFGAGMRDVRALRFAPPYSNLGGELALLPAAHKMAWRLNILLPRPQMLHDLGLLPSPQQSIGLWVTDQPTKKTTPLGYIDTVSGDPHDALSNLQFSPDGACVSFVYHHALWTVPTDRS